MWTRSIRRALTLALLASLVAAAGCTRFGPQRGAEQPQSVGVPVEIAVAEVGSIANHVVVTGSIRARTQAEIGAQVSARVLDVRVREGDSVNQGDVLITLDPGQFQSGARQARAAVEAADARLQASRHRLDVLQAGARPEERAIAQSRLEQAEAALRQAESDLSRMRGLFAQGAVAKQQLDAAQTAHDTARTNRDSALHSLELVRKGPRQEEVDAARKEVEAAEAGLDQARAALVQAEDLLGYTTIRSPLTGVVSQRHIEPGELVSSMAGPVPILSVVDPSSLYYEARVAETKANLVRAGQRVDVFVQTNGERAMQGVVERIVPVADPGSRDFLVRITIPDAGPASKPGVFARGDIIVAEQKDVVLVPKDAIVEREGNPVLFVVVDGKAQQRQIVTGLTDRSRTEILSGIDARDQVVIAGMEGLQDGTAVLVRNDGDQ